MHWLANGLNRKFAVGTAAGLLISSLVFLMLYIGLYRNELAQERAAAAEQVSNLLQTSLENAMLKRDLDGLRFIVRQLGSQRAVQRVFITNPRGEVRFSSDPQALGAQQAPPVEAAGPSSEFSVDASGDEVLRSINPVRNKPACIECHGTVSDNPLNGILYVDYHAASIRNKARRTTLLLMGSGALIVLINLAGGWWFMRRFVLQPIALLGAASTRLAEGDLATRAKLAGTDEFAQLGRNFDAMAAKLESTFDELRHQEAFLQSLIDAIPDGLRVIDSDFRIRLTNRAYRYQLGMDTHTAVGDTCHQSTHGLAEPCAPTLHTCPVVELRDRNEAVKVLHRHTRSDGSTMDVEIYAAAMDATRDARQQRLIVESIRDLAPQVQYSQEQKLSELGRLAAGVAHEIHNPLSSVRLALHASRQLLERDPSNLQAIEEYLLLVDREVDKCIEVTERLLKLSAPPASAEELVDVNSVVHETLSLLRWEAENDQITLEVDEEPGLRILATDSELRMLTLNLVQNAFHAMPKGGRVTIGVKRDHGRIRLVFADTGAGIATEDLPHIFDPFFSRRADGSHGTGLGLSITRNIVEKFDGSIHVESELGKGTRFIVMFPDPAFESGATS